MNYTEAIKKAKHLKAIGSDEVWLGDNDGEKPWHLEAKCEPGGSHRLEIHTSCWFRATEPKSGLKFRWDFDIEPYSANGSGSYKIDTAGVFRVLSMMHPKTAIAFRKYLADCAEKVQKKGEEWRAVADGQLRDADTLLRLSKP